MARVHFIDDFDYKPTPMSTIAYKAGMEMTVKRECAEDAIAKGKAVEVDPPRKTDNSEVAEVDNGKT